MSKVSAFVAAALFAAATVMGSASGALAKGGGGHGGGKPGGGHHGGGKHGGGKPGFHGAKHHGGGNRVHLGGRGQHKFHVKRGGRHGVHAFRGGRHAAKLHGFKRQGHPRADVLRVRRHFAGPAFRRAAPAYVGYRVTSGWGAHEPALRRGYAPLARPGLQNGLAARLYARPAFRAAAWPGPFFWSYGVDDVFWPTAYDDVFWTYGTADILAGILQPHVYAPAYGAPRRAYAPPRRGMRGERAAPELPSGAQLCGDQPAELAGITGIEAEVRPTAEQRALFDALRDAETEAVEMLKTACPSAIPPTPTGRLEAMAQWFDRQLQAVRAVRPPLETFYGALSDEQKARFLMIAAEPRMIAADPRDAAGRWLARCRGEPRAWASVPMEGIARELNLNTMQLAALDALSLASDEAVNAVRGSCPSEIPLTPAGRLAAIETRLAALAHAAHTLRPALERFYAVLSEEQKTRFNMLGASPRRHAG